MEKEKNQKTKSNPLVDKDIQTIETRSSIETNRLGDDKIKTTEELAQKRVKTHNEKTVERLRKE